MFIQLEAADRDLLTELVERRLKNATDTVVNRICAAPGNGAMAATAERMRLEALLCQLHETAWDVTA